MGRKILFVTTDQQRHDTLGCYGGALARTPVVDGLAADGIRYDRATPQSVVCMPSRSTILTGQHPRTHGVWMNGVPLPVDAPSVAAHAARRRLPHRARRQAALRAVPRPVPALHRELPRRQHHAAGRHPPRLRAPRVRHPHRRSGRMHYARWMAQNHTRARRRLLPGARPRVRGERRRRRRHRRAAGQGQPDADGAVPHRLGGRSDDRLARLARRRRRLVLLDELPRPAPPVGPAGVGGRPDRLARRAAAGRLPRVGRRARAHPRRQAPPLAALVRRHARLQLRGADRTGCRRRSPPTRSARSTPATPSRSSSSTRRSAGSWRPSPPAGGPTTSTSCSPPTTASSTATSACCSRGRTTSTG